ncbi:hypothetical protein M8494_18490 [Serratia ureilytica]
MGFAQLRHRRPSWAASPRRLNGWGVRRRRSALHLKKLEQQVGAPILRKAGRGMVMTEAETLLGYARLLEAQ